MIDCPVSDITTSVYTVPTDAPEADGTFAWNSTTLVLVQVRGEDVVGTGWTYGPPACAQVVDDMLSSVVLGRSALDVAGASEAMIRAVRNAGRPGIAGCALSAVDIALWDLAARLLDLPLHHLLGGVGGSVPVYGSGGFTTYDAGQLQSQLSGWVTEQRIPRVKIKIGESWGTEVGRDLERMRQAREVIGDGTELYVDANGAYGRKQAIRVAEAAEDCDIRWFEEPVSSDDLEGLREVRDAVRPDVTAGEYGYHLPYFLRMCAAGAVDCLQVDVTRCGGITEWRRAAAVAAAHGLDISGHCAPHVHAHVASVTPKVRHLEWFHDHVRIESLFFDGTLDPIGGSIEPDGTAPGLGLTLRAADVASYRVA